MTCFRLRNVGGVGAGLDDAMIGFADDQQGAMRLNGAREMNLFPFAVRKIGFSERWGSERMQRQINPLGGFLGVRPLVFEAVTIELGIKALAAQSQ